MKFVNLQKNKRLLHHSSIREYSHKGSATARRHVWRSNAPGGCLPPLRHREIRLLLGVVRAPSDWYRGRNTDTRCQRLLDQRIPAADLLATGNPETSTAQSYGIEQARD